MFSGIRALLDVAVMPAAALGTAIRVQFTFIDGPSFFMCKAVLFGLLLCAEANLVPALHAVASTSARIVTSGSWACWVKHSRHKLIQRIRSIGLVASKKW